MRVRRAGEPDASEVLRLMSALAVFERYDDRFAVTEDVLRERGFERPDPEFVALVEGDPAPGGHLNGLLVYYVMPFTLTTRPTLFIKELVVDEGARGAGVGRALMAAASREAVRLGCGQIKWQVADWNEPGKRFYEALGARPDPTWVDYSLDEAGLSELAHESAQGARPC
jgi:GNAT superfamily N-acetyltransferase